MPDSARKRLQQRWRRIDEVGRVAFWEWRIPEDRIVWSRHTAELFGIDRAPTTYGEFLALLHPEDQSRILAASEANRTAGGRFEHEFRVLDRAGEVRWILDRGETALGRDGRAFVMYGLSIDITAQKRAEAALAESEARLRAAQETALIGIHEWDIVRDEVTWDRTLRTIWGLDEQDPISLATFQAGVHPDDRATTEAAIEQALDPADGGVYGAEYRVINRHDGRVRWIHATGRVTFVDSRPVRLLGAAYEVSERRQAEQALRESEATFRAAFENAAVGIARVAPDGRWLMVNDRVCEILGYPRDELMQLSFQSLTHPDDLALDLDHLERLRIGEIRTYRTEKRYLRKGGGVVWGNLSVSAVPNADGSINHFISVIEDVSARKRAEEERELLIDELNHRVRNMLAVIRAIAGQTARYSDSLEAFQTAFDSRIQALAATHTLLSRFGWRASNLYLLLEQQVLLHAGRPDALAASGPEVLLAPKAALAISLVFHELASNAVRFGALSTPEGRISVTWTVDHRDDGQVVALRWTESGGPEARPPARPGFGFKLMEINLIHEFKGSIERDFRSDGLICELMFRLPRNRIDRLADHRTDRGRFSEPE